MKKRIFKSLFTVGISAVLLSCALTLLVSYRFYTSQAKEALKNQCYSLAKSYSVSSKEDFEDILKSLPKDIRVTLISKNGDILFESLMNTTENHSDRPEVIKAKNNGFGETFRYSSTQKSNFYYFATLLFDENILRLSMKTSNMLMVFKQSLPLIFLCIMLVLLVSILLSSNLTKKLLSPIAQMTDEIDSQNILAIYDELAPFVRKIRHQNKEIRKQMEKLQYERDTINVITSHMQEGMILVSTERTILSVNPSAINQLSSTNKEFNSSYTGKNILSISRIKELDQCVSNALNGKSIDATFENKGKLFTIYANPVYENSKVGGAILIIIDETQQKLAENIRQEFSSNVSHELKTPLTSILGYAEMIENGMAKSQDIQNFASRIVKESRRLISLINDIIHLSKIEESTDKLVSRNNIYKLCENAINSLKEIAEKRNISINLTGVNAIASVNSGMFEEMIYNLCENAIKYNKNNGNVSINICKDDKNAIITVSDTGIGIPEDAQDRIFERFYRVDKSRSKQVGGTGLGLSIVKHIVEYHNGKIILSSKLNIGTEIKIILPL